eukprot:CFRG1364T1
MAVEQQGTLIVRVDNARNITKLLKDKKSKLSDSYCEIHIGDTKNVTSVANHELNELTWNNEFIVELKSLNDIYIEIRLYALELSKGKDKDQSKPWLLGSYNTLLRILDLPKSLDSAKPKWYCLYEEENSSSTTNIKSMRKKSSSAINQHSMGKRVAGEVKLTISADYGSLMDGLRRQTIMLQNSGDAEVKAQNSGNFDRVHNAIEAKLKAVKIQIWEKKRYAIQAEKQLAIMVEALGNSPQQDEVRIKIEGLEKEIQAMEDDIGEKVLEDPRKVEMRKSVIDTTVSTTKSDTVPEGVRPRQARLSKSSTKRQNHTLSKGKVQLKMKCTTAWLTSDDHLSATVGDVLTVLHNKNPDWVYCQRGDTKGYIPKSCLTVIESTDDEELKLPEGYIPIKPRAPDEANASSNQTRESVVSYKPNTFKSLLTKANTRSSLSYEESEREKFNLFVANTNSTLSKHSEWYTVVDDKIDRILHTMTILSERVMASEDDCNSAQSTASDLPEASSPLSISKVHKPKPIKKMFSRNVGASARNSTGFMNSSQESTCSTIDGGSSSTRMKLEMKLMESEYEAKVKDLQAQLKNKDALILHRELEMKNTLLNFFEANCAFPAKTTIPDTDFNISDEELEVPITQESERIDLELKSSCERLRTVKAQIILARQTRQRENLANVNDKLNETEELLRLELSGESKESPPSFPQPSSHPLFKSEGAQLSSSSGPPPPPPPPSANWEPSKVEKAKSQPQSNDVLGSDMEKLLLNKLDQLDKLDNILHKLNTLQFSGAMVVGGDPERTMEIVQKEMETELAIIIDDSMTDKAREDANIKYEKLMNELDKHPDYKQMILKQKEELEAKNAPLNKAAWEDLHNNFTNEQTAADEELRKRLAKNPELALMNTDTKVISTLHQNDFRKFVFRGCSSQELRAIYHVLPKFRNDQVEQNEWKQRLQSKIPELEEQERVQAKSPKRVVTHRKLVRKAGNGSSNFMDELKARQHNSGEA